MSRTAWFEHDRFGMFIHWGLYSIPARGEWIRSHEKIPLSKYQPYFESFNPVRYDPASWARQAKAAGMKYAVLTAKHHDGFCLFDSALTDYKCTRTPARRDLVREFVDAFRQQGLKVGLYYSLIDWHHPDYPADRLHPTRDDPDEKARPRDFARYVEYLHGQVRELLTNYGKLDIMWFDFSYDHMAGDTWKARDLVDMVRSLQPHLLIDNRLELGHTDHHARRQSLGDFFSPEQIIPSEGITFEDGQPAPWEACITLNDHWGYHRSDQQFKTDAQVIRMLVECVSKGGNLLLNVGPTALGQIQPEARHILHQVGDWMDAHSESIIGCTRASLPKPEWGYFTCRPGKLYAHILNKPIGAVALLGLAGQLSNARLLRDGSEVGMSKPWMAGDNQTDAFLTLPGSRLPDERDTVVAMDWAPPAHA